MYVPIDNDKPCEEHREPLESEQDQLANPQRSLPAEPAAEPSAPPPESEDHAADSTMRPRLRKRRKLAETQQTEVCAAIAVGCSVRSAARLVGCSSQAILQLANRDPAFQARIQRAYMMAEFTPLKTIFLASRTHWRAAAWLLERLNRQEFGRTNPDTMTRDQFNDELALLGERLKQLNPNGEVRRAIHETFCMMQKLPAHLDPYEEPVRHHYQAGEPPT
jgi:hypothetical protein